MQNELEENQARKLQELFAEVANNPEIKDNEPIEKEEFVEMDILNLPPRSEVHSSSKRKLKLNIKKPFARFVFVMIILIAIITMMYFAIGDQFNFRFS